MFHVAIVYIMRIFSHLKIIIIKSNKAKLMKLTKKVVQNFSNLIQLHIEIIMTFNISNVYKIKFNFFSIFLQTPTELCPLSTIAGEELNVKERI